MEMARLEWFAGLYTYNDRVILPGRVLEAALINGSKKTRRGKDAQAGLFVDNDMTLEFPHSSLSVKQLWEMPEYRFAVPVVIQRARIIRTRPIFREWAVTATIVYDATIFELSAVQDIIRTTGDQIGVGDWRPKFGRFDVAFD